MHQFNFIKPVLGNCNTEIIQIINSIQEIKKAKIIERCKLKISF